MSNLRLNLVKLNLDNPAFQLPLSRLGLAKEIRMASSFSIQAVAERTGLTPHVIRAWERRYRAIEPERSSGKHRLYSEAEIERLAMLSYAVRHGHSIGKIATLSTGELRSMMPSRPAASPLVLTSASGEAAPRFRDEALHSVVSFDGGTLEKTLRQAQVALGSQGLLQLVIAPLAEEIGERWRMGSLTVAHEHFFTASVKIFLGDAMRQFTTSLNAPCIIVTTPTGQLHELGAMMVAAFSANLGWRSIYLGPGLPAHEIAGAAIRNNAAAVALSIVYPEDDPALPGELTDLARLLPATTRLFVGGRAAAAYSATLDRIGALYGDMHEFGVHLDSLRRAPAPGSSRSSASAGL